MRMASTEGHAILKALQAQTSQWIQLLPVWSLRISASCTALQTLATRRDHLGRGLAGCMFSVDYVHVWKREKDWEGEGNDRQLGQAVNCHSVPITTPLMSKPCSLGFSKLLHASGTVLRPAECPSDRETAKEKPGEKAEMKQGPISHVVLGSCLPPKT